MVEYTSCDPPPPANPYPEVLAALKEAAREAGSTNSEDFDIQFNVDIFSPGLKQADTEVWHHDCCIQEWSECGLEKFGNQIPLQSYSYLASYSRLSVSME